MKYNHNRPLKDFQDNINVLREGGFKPIAVTQMYFEDTYVFETNEEATNAYNNFEGDWSINPKKENIIVGWWFGKNDFLKEIKRYETDNNGYSKVKVYWLSED